MVRTETKDDKRYNYTYTTLGLVDIININNGQPLSIYALESRLRTK